MARRVTGLCLALLFWVASISANVHDPRALSADPQTAGRAIAPKLSGLGEHHYPVTTTSEASQAFFDQGLLNFFFGLID